MHLCNKIISLIIILYISGHRPTMLIGNGSWQSHATRRSLFVSSKESRSWQIKHHVAHKFRSVLLTDRAFHYHTLLLIRTAVIIMGIHVFPAATSFDAVESAAGNSSFSVEDEANGGCDSNGVLNGDVNHKKPLHPEEPQHHHSQSKASLPQKSVRFDAQVEYHASSPLCQGKVDAFEKEHLWYSSDDFALFRKRDRVLLKKLLQDEEDSPSSSSKKASSSPKKPCSYLQGIDRLFAAMIKVDFVLEDVSDLFTPTQEQAVYKKLFTSSQRLGLLRRLPPASATCCGAYKWYQLIGLEDRLVSLAHRTEFAKRRDLIQDIVQDIQCEAEEGMISSASYEEELRESVLHFTQASALFAQVMAKARAYVVEDE